MSRRFTVYNKQIGEKVAMGSVDELAQYINVPVSEIPAVRLYEYEVNGFKINEHLPEGKRN